MRKFWEDERRRLEEEERLRRLQEEEEQRRQSTLRAQYAAGGPTHPLNTLCKNHLNTLSETLSKTYSRNSPSLHPL